MNKVFKGSCMCGSIQFEYIGEPFSFNLCHCKMCQKFSGTSFGAFIGVNKKDFSYTSGKGYITIFESSDWASRSFCSKCGSSLMYLYNEKPDAYFVSAGLFDEKIDFKPEKHIFVKDKCNWYEILDNIPQIERY